jgi:hypothetical protein
MYDKDDKLLCASDKMIRLWDFWDQKEQSPELITSCESVLTVEQIFTNKNSKSQKGKDLLVLVVNQDEYALYRGRMDLVRKGNTSMHENQRILCAEFAGDNSCFWVGTDRGLLICFSVESGEEIGQAYNVSPEIEKPITSMRKFTGIDSDNIFLLVLGKKEAVVYSQQRKDAKPVIYGEDDDEAAAFQNQLIVNTYVAYNSKFFCIGIPSVRGLGFFAFNRVQFTFKPVKWLTKVSCLPSIQPSTHPFTHPPSNSALVFVRGLLYGCAHEPGDVLGRVAQDPGPPVRAVGLRLDQARRQVSAQDR